MNEWIKLFAPLVFSWPFLALGAALIFREPRRKLVERSSNVEIGPWKVKLEALAKEGQDAVHRLNSINELMAESRVLELEILVNNFRPVLPVEQVEAMEHHLKRFRALLPDAKTRMTEVGRGGN